MSGEIDMDKNMSAARTPGPWHFENGILKVADERVMVNHSSFSAYDANARLIAAAPDLLEALRPFARIADRADVFGHELGSTCEWRLAYDDLAKARAAIAKATEPTPC